MTQPGIEPGSPESLVNTLPTEPNTQNSTHNFTCLYAYRQAKLIAEF